MISPSTQRKRSHSILGTVNSISQLHTFETNICTSAVLLDPNLITSIHILPPPSSPRHNAMGHVRSVGACGSTRICVHTRGVLAPTQPHAQVYHAPHVYCPLHPWHKSQRHLHPWPPCSPIWWAPRPRGAALGCGQPYLRVHCQPLRRGLHACAGCST
jgi:hypothetical protein